MPRYLIQHLDGSERTIQADRLELAPPIQTCRFYLGDAAEDLALDAIRTVVLLDAGADDSSPRGGVEVGAWAPDAVEISQPSLLQPGTIAAVFVPIAAVEWLVGELRRARLSLPAGRRRHRAPARPGAGGKKTAKARRSGSKKSKARTAR